MYHIEYKDIVEPKQYECVCNNCYFTVGRWEKNVKKRRIKEQENEQDGR